MSHVQHLLNSTLEELQLTLQDVSNTTGLPFAQLTLLAEDKGALTGRVAILLEIATDVPALDWLTAAAKDVEESARAELPTPQQEAERFVQCQFELSGFAPESSRLTGRDKEVIRLTICALGLD